jgi:hypothetical protein
MFASIIPERYRIPIVPEAHGGGGGGGGGASALISCVIRRNVKRKLKPIDRVMARPG